MSSFLFYCLLYNHSFKTNPNTVTNLSKLLNYIAPASLLYTLSYEFQSMQAIAEKARDFFLLPWSEQLLRTRTNGFVSATDYDELYNELKKSNYDATSKLIGKLSKKQKLVLKLDYQEEIIAMENGQTTLVSKSSEGASIA